MSQAPRRGSVDRFATPPRRPPEALAVSPIGVAVLLHLVARDGRRTTVREVARAVDRSLGVVHLQLLLLRRAGLVDWTSGHHGTLRACVAEVSTVPRRGGTP